MVFPSAITFWLRMETETSALVSILQFSESVFGNQSSWHRKPMKWAGITKQTAHGPKQLVSIQQPTESKNHQPWPWLPEGRPDLCPFTQERENKLGLGTKRCSPPLPAWPSCKVSRAFKNFYNMYTCMQLCNYIYTHLHIFPHMLIHIICT